MVELKFSRNVHLASYPTAAGVPAAMGHDVRGAANGRQHWSVGPGSCPHDGKTTSAVGHGGSATLYKGPAAGPSLTPPSLFQTLGFQPFGAFLRYSYLV
jgi:hypothetical protein